MLDSSTQQKFCLPIHILTPDHHLRHPPTFENWRVCVCGDGGVVGRVDGETRFWNVGCTLQM
jgi:hypothetical protein